MNAGTHHVGPSGTIRPKPVHEAKDDRDHRHGRYEPTQLAGGPEARGCGSIITASRDEARATWDEIFRPANGFYLDSGCG